MKHSKLYQSMKVILALNIAFWGGQLWATEVVPKESLSNQPKVNSTHIDQAMTPIQVTANFLPETTDATLASVTVISRADIERSQALDLIEVLRQQVGIDINRTGGFGQSATILMRGANSNHTLVLLDGVRVASSNSGLYDFAHLPIDMIDRIEIVRGPRAAIWGSDAIGGVLQIFTRNDQGGHASLRVGRYGLVQAGLGYGDAIADRAAWHLQVGHTEAEGFSAQNEDGFGFDPDNDGYESQSLKLSLQHALGKTHQMAMVAQGVQATVEFDQGVTDVDTHHLGLTVEGDLTENWSHRLSAGSAYENLYTPAFFAQFTTHRQNLDWVDQYHFNADHFISTGYSYQHESGRTDDLFAMQAAYDESRHNQAFFARYRGQWSDWNLELTGRHDDNSAFGSEFTPQLALGKQWGSRWQSYLNFGEGFRAPNLNELYSPGFDGLFAGNPNLNAEHSRSIEAGVRGTLGGASLQLNVYRTKVDELISFSGGATFQAINIQAANLSGLELHWRGDWQGWEWHGQGNWQRAVNAVSDTDLVRRPKRKFILAADRTLSDTMQLGWEVQHVSARPDFGVTLKSYTLAALRLGLRISPNWRLDARIDNLFDEKYALATGFNTAGRSGQLALLASW